jgi:hypothetical protein
MYIQFRIYDTYQRCRLHVSWKLGRCPKNKEGSVNTYRTGLPLRWTELPALRHKTKASSFLCYLNWLPRPDWHPKYKHTFFKKFLEAYIFLKYAQWQCILSYCSSTAMHEDLKILHTPWRDSNPGSSDKHTFLSRAQFKVEPLLLRLKQHQPLKRPNFWVLWKLHLR